MPRWSRRFGWLRTKKESAKTRRGHTKRPLVLERLERRELLTASPAAPQFHATAVSTSAIGLSWNHVSGANGLVINELVGSKWKPIGYYSSDTTSTTVGGLSFNTSYRFDIVAFGSSGYSAASYASATTQKLLPPIAPSLTAAAASTSQIVLAWNQVSGASGYLVDELVGGAWKQIGNTASSTHVIAVTGLAAGGTYSFRVGAYNAAGTSWTPTVSAVTASPPKPPAPPAPPAPLPPPDPFPSPGPTPSPSPAPPTPPGTVNHPTAASSYANVSGSLFGASGPLFSDVHQGQVGDCWLMASLAEVAARDPQDIRNMFTPAGAAVENGVTVTLYSVRFYDSAGLARYVTVDTELPSAGNFYDHVQGGVLWVALAEKAYAQANAANIVTTMRPGSDSYAALDGGEPSWALHAITGKSAAYFAVNPTNIVAAWNAGQLIVLGSSPSAGDNLIVGDSRGTHAYAMIGYNATSGNPFELYNPWGLSSTVGATTTFNGSAVYSGAFYLSASLISQDFWAQYIGMGAEAGGGVGQTDAMAPESEGTTGFAPTSTPAGPATFTSVNLPISPASSRAPSRSQPASSFDSVDELFARYGEGESPLNVGLPANA